MLARFLSLAFVSGAMPVIEVVIPGVLVLAGSFKPLCERVRLDSGDNFVANRSSVLFWVLTYR
jgi:hypothetical protein